LILAKKMDLFYILKLNVNTILENNLKINISLNEAKKRGWVVSIGDNQLLKFIRDIKQIDFEKQKYKLEQIIRDRNNLKSLQKSLENSKKIYQYQKQIDGILFIPDLISVHANTSKKDYIHIAKNLFEVNGITFKRLCAGAGQLRRNTVLFVNEKLYDALEEIMMCGLTKKRIGKINLSKFSAYFSLYSSSTNYIRTPRVCIIPDYECVLPDQEVEWIDVDDKGERYIERRTIDVKQNVFDGSGLVSTEMAKLWNEDLGISDYSPSAYIIRSAWIKGLCVVFDWKRYAREVAKKEYIKDVWGNEKHIDDIDVLLSVSQFKMWKKYDSWEEYLKYHEKYGHIWGCSRVNKKKDNNLTALNYQYIQSNFFTPEKIKKLADFSIDWIKDVCLGERIYVLLYLLGCHEVDKDIKEIENHASIDMVKALMYCEDILKDSYVRDRIYRSIQKKINQIKIGKLLVEGSYEFAMVDPYLYCEYIFGQTPKGLLKEGQLWQKRWVDKDTKEVALFRSPLVSPHENNVLQVYSDEKCNDWYSTITSGVILNGWDTTLMRASDGDVDGDLLMTTDNPYILESVDRSLKPITYKPSMTKEQNLTYNNLVIMDTRSFNTKIGFITNLATTFICLRDSFSKNSEEYKELTYRINLLRFHQGSAIDAGKGNLYISPPSYWYGIEKINWKNDSSKEKQRKMFINRLSGKKKSYFMCYIYPILMKKYKEHKESSGRICRAMFGCKLHELFKKKNKTKEEKRFLNNYFKYMPVLVNKSIMNQLCWYVEDIDFDLKFYKQKYEFDYRILMNDDIVIDTNSNMFNDILKVLKKYHYVYELNANEIDTLENYEDYYEDIEENIDEEYSILFKEIENELFAICFNKYELCNYVIYIMYNYFKRKSKGIMWSICGKEIVDNLKRKYKIAYFPVESNSKNGIKYLDKYYELKGVEIDNI